MASLQASRAKRRRSCVDEQAGQPCNDGALLMRQASVASESTQLGAQEAAPDGDPTWAAASSSSEAAASGGRICATAANAGGSATSDQSCLQGAPLCPSDGRSSSAVAPQGISAGCKADGSPGPATAAAADGAAGAAGDTADEPAFSGLPERYLTELAAANDCLKRLPLPGAVPFVGVHPSCALLPLLCVYGIPPAAVALGASYFQRLMADNDRLQDAALRAGFFSAVSGPAGEQEVVMHVRPGCRDLVCVLCTCVYLGVKVTDGPQFDRQLSSMLTNILDHTVTTQQAVDLELRCLKLLDWRLGPYCCP